MSLGAGVGIKLRYKVEGRVLSCNSEIKCFVGVSSDGAILTYREDKLQDVAVMIMGQGKSMYFEKKLSI